MTVVTLPFLCTFSQVLYDYTQSADVDYTNYTIVFFLFMNYMYVFGMLSVILSINLLTCFKTLTFYIFLLGLCQTQ